MADEKDIDNLYSKVNSLSDRMKEIESTRPFLREMIERNIVSNEKLSDTLHEVQLSMVRMNEKMDEQSEALLSMRHEFEEANKKTNEKINTVEQNASQRISEINDRVNTVEEKGKFDIHLYIKQNWPWILIAIGFGIMYASQFIKF